MQKRKPDINLASGLDEILDFNDPRISDVAFEKALVDAVYDSIVTSWTCGTDDAKAYGRAQDVAQRRVDAAVAKNGLDDRNKVVRDIFNANSDFGEVPASLKSSLRDIVRQNHRKPHR